MPVNFLNKITQKTINKYKEAYSDKLRYNYMFKFVNKSQKVHYTGILC